MDKPSSLFLTAPFLALSFLTTAAHAASPLRIKTDNGVVEGTLTNGDQVRAFKGIPFAAPPVGDLRWQPPQPAAKWKGVRPAKAFAPPWLPSPGHPAMVFHYPGPLDRSLTTS